MPGFFDLNDPNSALPLMGLLAGLGQAAAPSPYPTGIGQMIGLAAQGYMGGKQNAQEYQQRQNALAMQRLQMQQQLGMANAIRRGHNLPDLSMDDYLKGASDSAPFGQSAQAPQQQAPQQQQSPPAPPQLNEQTAQGALKSFFPGATITSGLRTPLHNQQVGGVPNSMHLSGNAVDFVLPKGVTFEDVKAHIAQAGLPATELLNEGDHVHWGWGPKGGQAPMQVAGPGAPAPQEQSAPQPQNPFANLPEWAQYLPPEQVIGMMEKQLTPIPQAEVKNIQGANPNSSYARDYLGNIHETIKSDLKSPGALQQDIQQAGAEAKAKLDAVPGLNPEAIDFFAQQYNQTGKIPPMYRDQASRAMIMNKAADIAAQGGQTAADVVAGQAGTKASMASLSKVSQYRNMVESFAQTANANANMALQLAGKGAGNTGVPVLNAWVQAGRTNVAGSPDVSAFNAALITFKNEYAKIMSGQTGGQGTSDASRREADELINKSMTVPQLQATIATMQREMENRRQSLLAQEAEIKGSLNHRPVQAPAFGAAPAAKSDPLGIR